MSHHFTENEFWFSEFCVLIDFRKNVLLGRKGNIFKVECKEQHVICTFSYNNNSKNENIVQDLQVIS